MLYTVYKITNTINNKIYVGVHKTNNIDDGYMGSGVLIKRAQEKYGIENFTKEILHYCDSIESMFDMESQIVNEEFVKQENVYNLVQGGFGGYSGLSKDDHREFSQKGRQAANIVLREKYGDDWQSVINKMAQDAKTPESYKQAQQTHLERYGTKYTFEGKTHTTETKQKMSDAKKGKGTGVENSQYGSCWVYSLDLKKSKKIKSTEIDQYIENGWLKGRKIKF